MVGNKWSVNVVQKSELRLITTTSTTILGLALRDLITNPYEISNNLW